MSKAEEKFEFTEEEMIELVKLLKAWRKRLEKHPEVPDYTALLQVESHFMRRLTELVSKRYFKEKGLD
jgi:hypothetical protein